MIKYPPRFDDATHGLVLGTYRSDDGLFVGGCRIVRRPAGMVAIEGAGGATFTFAIEQDEKGRETGKIKQVIRAGAGAEFKIIPYNQPSRS